MKERIGKVIKRRRIVKLFSSGRGRAGWTTGSPKSISRIAPPKSRAEIGAESDSRSQQPAQRSCYCCSVTALRKCRVCIFLTHQTMTVASTLHWLPRVSIRLFTKFWEKCSWELFLGVIYFIPLPFFPKCSTHNKVLFLICLSFLIFCYITCKNWIWYLLWSSLKSTNLRNSGGKTSCHFLVVLEARWQIDPPFQVLIWVTSLLHEPPLKSLKANSIALFYDANGILISSFYCWR